MFEAQLAETAIINMVNLQVNIAVKVSRCVHAAQGRSIVDFSLRRTQGADAGMAVARSGFIAGMNATSNVLAGKTLGIPVCIRMRKDSKRVSSLHHPNRATAGMVDNLARNAPEQKFLFAGQSLSAHNDGAVLALVPLRKDAFGH